MIYDFEKNVPEVHPEAWVAANATLIGKIKLEKNSSIWFNAVPVSYTHLTLPTIYSV